MQLLIDHINNGFSESSSKCPDNIKPFFSFSVCNGVVLKAIKILHNKAHLGLNKTLEHA